MNLVEAYLAGPAGAEVARRLGVGRRAAWPPASLVITPRYPDSRHVVFVLRGAGLPGVVAKVVRAPDDRSTLGHEADVLAALPPQLGGSAPTLLAFDRFGGHWLLIETAVPGRPLTHHDVRRAPARWHAAVDRWMLDLPLADAGEDDGPLGAALRHRLDLAARSVALTPPEQQLLERTWQALRPLAAAGWPTVVEHADLSHPNLLRRRPDPLRRSTPGLGVVDWESAHQRGLPGADAAVFLAFLAFAVDRAHGTEPEVACFERWFVGADARGRAMLAAHLRGRGLDPVWADHVLLAAWCRTSLAVFPRLLTGAGAELPTTRAAAARAWRAGRSRRLWQLALGQVEQAGAGAGICANPLRPADPLPTLGHLPDGP